MSDEIKNRRTEEGKKKFQHFSFLNHYFTINQLTENQQKVCYNITNTQYSIIKLIKTY